MNKLHTYLLTLGIISGIMIPQISNAVIPSRVGGFDYASQANEDNTVVEQIKSPATDYAETDSCSAVEHGYVYTNTSEDTETQKFRAVVYAYAIELDDDFMDNIDLSTIACSDGHGSYASDTCDISSGSMTLTTSERNGTEITFERLDWVDGSPYGIVWRYNRDDPSDKTGYVWLDEDESKTEAIAFIPEEFTTFQTATTRAWTKVQFYEIDPDVFASGSYSLSDYTETYPEDVDTNGDGINNEDDEVYVDQDGDGIYWYGVNDILQTAWNTCEEGPLGCSLLEVSPTSSEVSVNDLYKTRFSSDPFDIEVTAYDSDGTDITSDSEFRYQSFAYGDTYSTTDPTANTASGAGRFQYGVGYLRGGTNDETTSDSTIRYNNGQPGESIVIFETENPEVCNAVIELPYCADLSIVDPSWNTNLINGTEVDIDVEVEMTASNGEVWPYDINYSSDSSTGEFDGNSSPYNTTDTTVTYTDTNSASVTAAAADDVDNFCSDSFTYTLYQLEEPYCLDLTILVPTSPVPAADMEAGLLEVTWESNYTDGPASGPWVLISSNPSGEFYLDSSGSTLMGTGTVLSIASTVYYTGEAGDTISVTDASDPSCTDSLSSLTTVIEEDEPFCETLDMKGPYLEDGTLIDVTVDEELSAMYDETTVCFQYGVNVDSASFTGTLQAESFTDSTESTYGGTINLEINETGTSDAGNPATLALDAGLTTYTGTVCIENFDENYLLKLFVVGEEEFCSDESEFPPLPEEIIPVCELLKMNPDSYVMTADAVDAGRIDLDIEVHGDDPLWSGNLIIEHTGPGSLLYADGTTSAYIDGHLEIPVAGTSDTVFAIYMNGDAGDIISSYIESESEACADNFEITQISDEEPVCIDLSMDPDSYKIEEGSTEDVAISINVKGETADWKGHLQLLSSGTGTLETEEFDVAGTSTDVSTYLRNAAAGDSVAAYIDGEESYCNDTFKIDPIIIDEEPVCNNIEIDPSLLQAIEGEDQDVSLSLDSELEDQTILFKYSGCKNGTIEYKNASYSDELEIEGIDGSGSFDLTLTNLCDDAEISAEVVDHEDTCYDEATAEILEVGEFEKFIFTFNFAVEKSAYSDEGIFFSHDEDRAFYTLEYDPVGQEESITFTDKMWTSSVPGYKGDGTQVGSVKLAKSYAELTSGRAYTYPTIVNFGFGRNRAGQPYELNADKVETYVKTFSASDFQTFVPYIKYDDNSQSDVIPECEYTEEVDDEGNPTGEKTLDTESYCFNPDEAPETTGQVVIENVDTVPDNASIRIRYVGVVDSADLDCSSTEDECLTLEFQNDAAVELYDGEATLEANAKLVVLCSYLVTRNAGDVYLEVGLTGGSDISCIFVEEESATSPDYRNVDALVILEGTQEQDTSETYTPFGEVTDVETSYQFDTISICDNTEYEDNLIGNLSSYVCEIITSVTDLWKSSFIESETESRVSQATRNVSTLQTASTSSFNSGSAVANWENLRDTLKNQNNPDSGILYFDGSLSDTITLGHLEVESGAWTLIVENADLVLAGDIDYTSTSDPTNLASIAFVVLGGDIHVKTSATNLSGVFYTDQSFTGDERSPVDDPLRFYGSIYGNVQPLLDAAKYVGHPSLDEGGVVVRYDERIILNTPPGLAEYVDVTTEKGVN